MKHTLIIGIFALTGCTTAGPFVSNISSDGKGEVVVEKCMVHFNAFLGVIQNSDCTNVKVKLIQPPEIK
jgi:type IV secretion system protein VirB7